MNVHSIDYHTLKAMSSIRGLYLEQDSKLNSAKTTISVLISPIIYPHRRTLTSVKIFSDQSQTRYRPETLWYTLSFFNPCYETKNQEIVRRNHDFAKPELRELTGY